MEWSSGLNWFDLEVEVDERKHKTLQILQPKTLGGNKLGIHLIYRAQQNNKAFISSRTTKFSYKFKPNSQEWLTHPEHCMLLDNIKTAS